MFGLDISLSEIKRKKKEKKTHLTYFTLLYKN